MLISYPVLPAAAAHADEDVYLGNIIEAHVIEHEGRYPVSTLNTPSGPIHRWHGGVHLYGGGEPIRAIADGTVVALRAAAARETYEGLGEYDTSFVLIRHETQSGENTTVVFYSLYMHLASRADMQADRFQQLPLWLRQVPAGPQVQTPANQRIWRKDALGFAGQLYGREACHVEVFTTDAAFNALWRDSTAVTQGAGSADFFGDAHFVIPAGQTFVERHPRAAATGAHRIDFPGPADYALPLGQAGQNANPLFVSVTLQRGRRIATTSQASPDNIFVQVGHPVVQDDYEYELYRLATALYPDCPSAGFEWLRFGRVLGPDSTTRNENWQLVRYGADAMGYINLAPQAIAKLSDADFPHWRGWERRDEGQTANANDGICDDQRTIALSQASTDESRRKLRHLICKAPSEWDDADLATRYARMREPGQPLETDDSWNKFQQHVQKMAFWSQAGLTERSVWHFHPLQFVRHYRGCGWLSAPELAQTLPRRRPALLGWATALQRATDRALAVNIMTRKYIGHSRQRIAHALAQIFIETDLLNTMSEYSLGNGHAYGAFYGRGLMQLTWAKNYESYGTFRQLQPNTGAYQDQRITATSLHVWESGAASQIWAPRYDPQFVEMNSYSAGDSGGFYWVSKTYRGTRNINRVCDLGSGANHVGYISWLVNGGANGYRDRQLYFAFVSNELFDTARLSGLHARQYPAQSGALTGTFPPGSPVNSDSVQVNYEQQIP
jgi:predicted chitinase